MSILRKVEDVQAGGVWFGEGSPEEGRTLIGGGDNDTSVSNAEAEH